MEANLTRFIVSDAHNTTSSTSKMGRAFNKIENKFDSNYVYVYLFTENVELLVEDKDIYKEMLRW